MYYTVYKIINKINGKYYIGKHQTKDLDDGYFGSGKLLKPAIKKHGIENFRKEILYVFDNEADMNAKEKELAVVSEETYNLCEGGQGGFGYINSTKSKEDRSLHGKKCHKLHPNLYKKNLAYRPEKIINTTKSLISIYGNTYWKNIASFPKSESHKKKISESVKRNWDKKRNIGVV